MKKLQLSSAKQSKIYWLMVIITSLTFIFSLTSHAQDVIQNGNVFIEQVDSSKSQDVKTGYVYIDKKGDKYPIYLSKNGNAYIIRTSKRGKKYRKYLPTVTEKLETKKD